MPKKFQQMNASFYSTAVTRQELETFEAMLGHLIFSPLDMIGSHFLNRLSDAGLEKSHHVSL